MRWRKGEGEEEEEEAEELGWRKRRDGEAVEE